MLCSPRTQVYRFWQHCNSIIRRYAPSDDEVIGTVIDYSCCHCSESSVIGLIAQPIGLPTDPLPNLMYKGTHVSNDSSVYLDRFQVLTMTATNSLEQFTLGQHLTVPRLWSGLWQLSSNAWGSASASDIREDMSQCTALGLTAFGGCERRVTAFSSNLMLSPQIW